MKKSATFKILFYIDDIFVISQSTQEIKNCIQIINNWALKNNSVINFAKSCLATSLNTKSKIFETFNSYAQEIGIPLKNSIRYLGFTFNLNSKINTFLLHTKERRQKTRIKSIVIAPFAAQRGILANNKLLKSIIIPSLSFGSRAIKNSKTITTKQNYFLHRELSKMLQLDPSVPQAWLRWETQTLEWNIRCARDKQKFCHKLLKNEKEHYFKNIILNETGSFCQSLQNINDSFKKSNSLLLSMSKKSWNKKMQEIALMTNHEETVKHITCVTQYRVFTMLYPFTSTENHSYAKKAESMKMAYVIIKLRANEMFNENFNCQWCNEKLTKNHAMYHLIFLCQKIDNKILWKNLIKDWSEKLKHDFEKLSIAKKFVLLLGINKSEKTNTLHEMCNHINNNLIFIKSIYEKISLKIINKSVLSSYWNGYED